MSLFSANCHKIFITNFMTKNLDRFYLIESSGNFWIFELLENSHKTLDNLYIIESKNFTAIFCKGFAQILKNNQIDYIHIKFITKIKIDYKKP